MDTLRKSMTPQSQFESLVSEPERNLYVTMKHKFFLTNEPKGETNTRFKPHRMSAICRSCHYELNANKNNHKPQEICIDSIREDETDDQCNDEKTHCTSLEQGHVGHKISVYEENARKSITNSRKRRNLGVPLVGMHNACGLPIVASWSQRETLKPVRIAPKVSRRPRTVSNNHTRRRTKRRAPQPNTIQNCDHESTCRRTKVRRPSFKTCKKMNTISSRNSFKRNNTGLNNHVKRRTVYARDDGDDAVKALKDLCINPMARNKSEIGMIW